MVKRIQILVDTADGSEVVLAEAAVLDSRMGEVLFSSGDSQSSIRRKLFLEKPTQILKPGNSRRTSKQRKEM